MFRYLIHPHPVKTVVLAPVGLCHPLKHPTWLWANTWSPFRPDNRISLVSSIRFMFGPNKSQGVPVVTHGPTAGVLRTDPPPVRLPWRRRTRL